MNETWDEVWLDWHLGMFQPTGMMVVDHITEIGVKGVSEYFVHTSDPKEGVLMVAKLQAHVSEPVRYVPDIDYTLALGRR